ncbi:MAG: hypothetical protein CML13_04925 [Puniceicoccaceae bacterium]|nr:hypothetical protein [Puniceicoccaceae bacterium]|tara:strand:+ start:3915 stop:5012 length:1098 start_codon:yes stop_codon:yes gene_type:complete
MFPWDIDDLGRIVVGRPLLPIFQEIFLESSGRKPSRATLEKLAACDTSIRLSTLNRYGIGFAHDVFDHLQLSEKQITARSYGEWFDVVSDMLITLTEIPEAQGGHIFHKRLRELFPRTIHSILWVEDWWIGFCEQGGTRQLTDPAGPTTSYPIGICKNAPASYTENERRFRTGLILEHHHFMLYFAAFEEDLKELEGEFTIPCPSEFVPIEKDGIVHYPMWAFWRWFQDKAGCETWGELAEKADFNRSDSADGVDGEQVVRNYANAKPKQTEMNAADCKMISWNRLRQALKQIEGPDSNPFTPFQMEVQWGYGIARILQEHAARCLPTVLDFCSSEFPLKSFYQDRIALCKQNECRRIPALIAKL